MLAAVFYPNFRGPDELPHVGLVVSVAQRSVDWEPGSQHMQLGVQKAPLSSPNRLHGSLHLGKNSMPARGDRPSYHALGGDRPTHFINYIVQHPPLYYLLTGTALGVVPHWKTMPFDRVVLLLRLLTALMIIPVPWFCYAAARTMGGGRGVSIAAAAVPLMSPQLIHISATVNNDALLTLLGSATIWLAARVYQGDLSARRAGQLGLLSAAIALTKGFGLIVVFMVVAIYAISLIRYRGSFGLGRPLTRCALWFVPPILISATWWFGNLRLYGRLQPDGTLLPTNQHFQPPAHTTFAKSGSSFVRTWLDGFTQRFWFDDPTGMRHHGLLHLVALVMTLSVVALALLVLIRAPLDRWFVSTMIAGVVVTTIELMRLAWPAYRFSHWVGAAQGRYLFALSAGIGLLIAFGLGAVFRGSERWVPRIAVSAAVLFTIIGAADTARWYWLPAPGDGNRVWRSVQNLFYVSAMPPWLLAPLIVVVVGLTVATVWAVWAPGRPQRFFDRWTGGRARRSIEVSEHQAEPALAPV